MLIGIRINHTSSAKHLNKSRKFFLSKKLFEWFFNIFCTTNQLTFILKAQFDAIIYLAIFPKYGT